MLLRPGSRLQSATATGTGSTSSGRVCGVSPDAGSEAGDNDGAAAARRPPSSGNEERLPRERPRGGRLTQPLHIALLSVRPRTHWFGTTGAPDNHDSRRPNNPLLTRQSAAPTTGQQPAVCAFPCAPTCLFQPIANMAVTVLARSMARFAGPARLTKCFTAPRHDHRRRSPRGNRRHGAAGYIAERAWQVPAEILVGGQLVTTLRPGR